MVFTSITKTGVDIVVTVDKPGEIACGFFPNDQQPQYISSVFLQGFKANTGFTSKNVSLALSGMTPASIYAIYCVTTSNNGVVMDLEQTLDMKSTVETKCCKSTEIRVLTNAISLDTNAGGVLNAFSLSLQSLPQTNITYTVSLVLASINGTVLYKDVPTLPSAVTIKSDMMLSSTFFSLTSSVISLAENASTITITVATTGSSANEYELSYPLGNVITILAGNSQPKAPQLSSATLTADGQSVIIQFDSATNLGGISDTIFACSRILSFIYANSTYCSWKDPSSIRALLDSSSIINVGDKITLNALSLKAKCLSPKKGCGFYNYTEPNNDVVVQRPSATIPPSVMMIGPSTVSVCNSIMLDLSYSTGALGRQWNTWKFTVINVNDQNADMSSVVVYLDNHFSISPPITIPAGLLSLGSYKISVTLTNFLGSSSTGSFDVSVIDLAVPIVTIAGPQLMTMYRKDYLKLISNAYLVDCTNSSSKDSLLYDWSISSDDVKLSLRNQANSESSFILNPWSLTVGELYTVMLTVTSSSGLTSASTTVQVYIKQNDIVAVIGGGSQQSIKIGSSTLSLDASNSFDRDVASFEQAALSYRWSCVTTAPILSNFCQGLLWLTPQNVSMIDVRPLNTTSPNSTFVISVNVYDSTRSDTAAVTVNVIDLRSPIVTVTSSFPTKINPTSKIVINAIIEDVVSTGQASWTAINSGGNNVDITSYALSPLLTSLTSSSAVAFNLILSPNALLQQQSQIITFKLSVKSTVAAINIEVNGNPTPGTFATTPAAGFELQTMFTLTASGWNDVDLPLSYSFGYYSSSSSSIVNTLKAASTTSYMSSNLPAGPIADGNTISCLVTVYDSLGAHSVASSTVTVSNVELSTTELSSIVTSKLNDLQGSSDLDATRQAVTVMATIINAIDCSNATSTICSLLNRNGCTTVANTCGECLTGFVSSAKVGNTKCKLLVKPTKRPTLSPSQPSQRPTRRPTLAPTSPTVRPTFSPTRNPSSAPSTSPTMTPSMVPSGRRLLLSDTTVISDDQGDGSTGQQECANNCNDHGTCVFQSISSGKAVALCDVYDPTCEAVCVCNDGYGGSLCSYDTATLLVKQGTRYQLLNAYSSLVSSSNIDSSTLSSLTASLVALTSNVDEISLDAVQKASAAANTLLDSALSLSVAYTDILTILDAIDIIQTATILNNGTFIQSLNVPLTGFKTMKTFGTLLVKQQGLGESDYNEVFTKLRLKGQASLINGTKVVLTPALSALESFIGVDTSTITMYVNSNVKDLNVATGVINGRIYGSSYVSDAVAVVLDDTSKCSSNDCEFLLKLNNYDTKYYYNEDIDVNSMSNVTVCEKDKVTTTVYSCSGGTNRTVACNGTFIGYIKSMCPYEASKPSCDLLTSSSLASKPYSGIQNDCSLQSYDSLTTTCLCNIPSALSTGRRQLSTSSSIGSYHFIASEKYYVEYPDLEYYSQATPSPSMPGYTTVLTVQQTFIGLDVRDFNTPSSLAANGDIIKLALSASIGYKLTKDSIAILSVSAGSRRQRQLLASSATFIYTITTADADANNLKSRLDQVVNDGSLATYLYSVATSVSFVGYSDFYAVSPQLAVYLSAPTLSPTRGPEVFSTNLLRNAVIIGVVGFFIVTFVLYMVYRKHTINKEKERLKLKSLAESTADFTNGWLSFMNNNKDSKQQKELNLRKLSDTGESKEESYDDKYMDILSSIQNPVDNQKYDDSAIVAKAADDNNDDSYFDFWNNYITKPIVTHATAGSDLLFSIPSQVPSMIPISITNVTDSQTITVRREDSNVSGSGWMTSDSDSDNDNEIDKNTSFDYQQGTLDDWMASYDKFSKDSRRGTQKSFYQSNDVRQSSTTPVVDWLGLTTTKPPADNRKSAISTKEALDLWISDEPRKSAAIVKATEANPVSHVNPRRSIHSGPGAASVAHKEVITTLAQKNQIVAVKKNDQTISPSVPSSSSPSVPSASSASASSSSSVSQEPLPSKSAPKNRLSSKHLQEWLYSNDDDPTDTRKPLPLAPRGTVVDDWIFNSTNTTTTTGSTMEPTRSMMTPGDIISQATVDDWLDTTTTSTTATTNNNSNINKNSKPSTSKRSSSFYFDS